MTKTTESLSLNKPEEVVRQRLIEQLAGELGFPASLIVVEKALNQLPHLQGEDVPDRRVDILCYAKRGEELFPLLLIECKAVPLNDAAVRQVVGYNEYVGAQYVALCNESEVRLGGYDPTTANYRFISKWVCFDSLLGIC